MRQRLLRVTPLSSKPTQVCCEDMAVIHVPRQSFCLLLTHRFKQTKMRQVLYSGGHTGSTNRNEGQSAPPGPTNNSRGGSTCVIIDFPTVQAPPSAPRVSPLRQRPQS